MKIFLCYHHGSVVIKWNLPFFPRIGEYISTAEFLSEKELTQLGAKEDYLKIINIAWFPNKNSRKSSVEIVLE